MLEVDRLSDELASAIRDSDEYKTYLKCYNDLSQHPSLMRDANELRKNNLQFQNSEEEIGMFEKVEEFSKRYAQLRLNRVVSDFLQAELCLGRMIQSVMKTIVSKIDFDTSFLDD